MERTGPRILPSIGLAEMGHPGEVAVRVVAANLQTAFGLAVNFLTPLEIPEYAFQRHRQQYDAALIVKHLGQEDFPDHVRILVVTSLDLCIPILTHVYGEAEIGGKAAVVSNCRLRYNEDRTLAPLDQYYERLAKVAVHEVAHTFSLYHCEDPECVMHFSARVQHLDRVRIAFCRRCAFLLATNLKQTLRRQD